MPQIGSAGVSNYVNTTQGLAQGVEALDGVGGAGVSVLYSATPVLDVHIITETTSAILNTESSDKLITQD